MASKLLNVLQNIEQSRQNGVNTLANKGYQINPNASFDDLFVYFNELEDENYNRVISTNEYLDPDTDPEIWREPADWPDIKSILLSQTDTATQTPVLIALLDNTVSETVFKTGQPSSTDLSTFGYQQTYAQGSKVITSDGSTYDLDGTTVTHTWDSSQDINGKYRYIIVFERFTVINASNQWLWIYRLNAVALACCNPLAMDGYTSTYNSSVLDAYKTQAVYMINPVTEQGIALFRNKANASNKRGTHVTSTANNYADPLRKICVCNPIAEMGNSWGFNGQGQLFRSINYIEQLNVGATSLISSNGCNNLYYYKGTFKTFPHDNSTYKPRLKYVYIVDGASVTEIPSMWFRGCTNIRTDLLAQFPNLTTINNLCFMDSGFVNCKLVALNTVTNIATTQPFQNIDTLIFALNNIETLNMPLVAQGSAKYIQLAKLKTLNAGLGNFSNLVYLDLPNLETILVNSDIISGLNNYSLDTINVPKLTTVARDSYFNWSNLKNLILKDGFKFNLALNNCTRLSVPCALDILNKCAQLEEGEVYTIKFNSNMESKLEPEDIAIATDKGWTVLFS